MADGGRPLDAVTFDFWNTIAYELRGHLRSKRLEAWAGLIEEAGFALERRHLDAIYEEAWERHVASWQAGEQFGAAQAAEQLLEGLGFDVPDDLRGALIEAFATAGQHAELHLADGLQDCLRALRDGGLRLGIVCDVGFTPSSVLRGHLHRLGVLELFDHWSFSDEVGHYKPSPVIFEHALAGLGGVDPGRAAHIGDIRRTDVAGALAMGMVAVRYRGISDDDTQPEPEGHHVVDHHREVPVVLGVHTG
jgi:FMN phosphatase YigB (HAD superfamily)